MSDSVEIRKDGGAFFWHAEIEDVPHSAGPFKTKKAARADAKKHLKELPIHVAIARGDSDEGDRQRKKAGLDPQPRKPPDDDD